MEVPKRRPLPHHNPAANPIKVCYRVPYSGQRRARRAARTTHNDDRNKVRAAGQRPAPQPPLPELRRTADTKNRTQLNDMLPRYAPEESDAHVPYNDCTNTMRSRGPLTQRLSPHTPLAHY